MIFNLKLNIMRECVLFANMNNFSTKIKIYCNLCNTNQEREPDDMAEHVEYCKFIHPERSIWYNTSMSHIGWANYMKAVEKQRFINK